MTGAEHYREAERLLAASRPDSPDERDAVILAAAQVHATLAHAAAVALAAGADIAAYESTHSAHGDPIPTHANDWWDALDAEAYRA